MTVGLKGIMMVTARNDRRCGRWVGIFQRFFSFSWRRYFVRVFIMYCSTRRTLRLSHSKQPLSVPEHPGIARNSAQGFFFLLRDTLE